MRGPDMTFVGWLIIVFVAAGTCLISGQLMLKDLHLAAAATGFLGGGVTLTAFKAHRSAVSSARLVSEHRREAARARALLVEMRRVVEASQMPSGLPAASVQGEFRSEPAAVPVESQAQSTPLHTESGTRPSPMHTGSGDQQSAPASRSIGRLVAAIEASTVKVADRGTRGRQAAAVTQDEARPWKLFSATLGMGVFALSPDRHSLRQIAGVVSPKLLSVLEVRYAFTQFHPGLVPVELDYAQPSALVFEESAFEHGVWFGALRTTGMSLFADIQSVVTWARTKSQSIFVLPDSTPGHNAGALRRQATYLVQPGLVPTEVADVSLPLLESLLEYVSKAKTESRRSASEARLAS
jgi:hypothetical protein